MTLKVRDVHDLESQLMRQGQGIDFTDEKLASATAWFEDVGHPKHVFDRQTFAALCEYSRSESDPAARALAIGLLSWLPGAARESLDLARFATCFVLRRIANSSERPILWGGIWIPPSEAALAAEIFKESLAKPAHSDDELVGIAEAFIERHETSSDLFGRFAQDLAVLAVLLKADDTPVDHRDVARAALDYFARESDAIPDHLGLVGLLDDAFVVRRAIEQIRPGRAALAAFLDRIVSEWPFLRNLVLAHGEHEYALSEFMLINLALVSCSIEGETAPVGRVLVTPDPGPLAMLVGWIQGLAGVREFVEADSQPRFERGEQLKHRDTKAIYTFQSYGQLLPNFAFVECTPESATYFRVTRGGVTHTNPISDLGSLARSAKAGQKKKQRRATLKIDSAKLGPLERIFGVPSPIAMPDAYGRVIVVAPLGESRAIVEQLTLHDVRLADVIPLEQAQVEADLPSTKRWGNGVGGEALVTVVRSAADALELVEVEARETIGVVASVRPESTDAVHLSAIASRGIPVLAIVEERDGGSLETFRLRDFAFWSWDDEWLGQLHWNSTVDSHPVASYEKDFRRRAAGRVDLVSLELPGLLEASAQLRLLDRAGRENQDELLDELVKAGFGILVGICRCQGTPRELSGGIDELARVERNSAWWTDAVVVSARDAIGALREAVRSAADRNPKSDLIRDWTRDHPKGVILARSRMVQEVQAYPDLARLPWMDARRPAPIDGPVLIPAWMGKSTMSEFLVPPIAESVTLALYAPEREWYQSLVRSQQRSRAQLTKLVRKRSAVPIEAVNLPEPVEPPAPEPTIDDIVDRVRRAAALRKLGGSNDHGTESVEVRLVYFHSGYWAPFTPDHRVNSVTHLFDPNRGGDARRIGTSASEKPRGRAEASEGPADSLRELPASELRVGDRIVVVRGSEHDAIRHAADTELRPGLRQMAGEWREAVRRFLASGKSVADLRRRLNEAGCKRTDQSIRLWAKEDRIIGPMGDDTVAAIQQATGDERLAEVAVECSQAIAVVRGTHLSVAHRLAERVLEGAKSKLGRLGTGEDALELGDQLLLLTVEAIDGETIRVPRHEVNRLMDGEDTG
jgi:uncharacterized membrane protein YkvA (DUF1232 family)